MIILYQSTSIDIDISISLFKKVFYIYCYII